MISSLCADNDVGLNIRAAGILLLLAGILYSSTGQAQWRFEPSIAAGFEYDDNAILTTRTDIDASVDGYAAEVDARISYESEVTKFWMLPRFRSTRYSDAEELDADDQFLTFDYLRTGQASGIRLRGSYTNESIRTAERSDADLGVEDPEEIPDDDSGRVASNEKRQRILLAPEWSYRFNEISSIRTVVRYLDVSYDDDFAGVLTDYSDTTFGASYNRAVGARTTAIFGAFARRYDSTENTNESTGYGVTAGFNRKLSETTQIRARIGAESNDDPDGDNSVNPIGEIALSQQLKTIKILAAYQRTISGGGSGVLSVRDQISLNFTRDLNEKITAGIGVRAYQTNSLDDNQVNVDERDYVQLRSIFVWNLTKTFALDFDYRYTFIDRASLGEGANSNQINVWLNYHPIF